MSETTPKKKKRWTETLPNVDFISKDRLLIDAAKDLVVAISADEEDYMKTKYADWAAAEIRAFRKSLNVDSEREEVPTLYLDEWETTGDNALWQALRDVSLAAIWADKDYYYSAQEVAGVLRGAEAFLREHWYQRPENQAPTETRVTVCSCVNECE